MADENRDYNGIVEDSIPQYLGKEVVVELGRVGGDTGVGTFSEYDGAFLTFVDYSQSQFGLSQMRDHFSRMDHDAAKKSISKGHIASIQCLEDILDRRDLAKGEQTQ